MKVKLVLLLIAVVGSTALVASAQPPTAYVVTDGKVGESQDVLVNAPPAPPQPPVPPVPAPLGARFIVNRAQSIGVPRQDFVYYSEENGLSQQAERFAQQLASARSDSDREKIKGQLAELLEKQFDQRQKRHEEEIKQLEAQIKKLKDLVEKRQENRREIIRARLTQIERESQGLGW